VTSAGTTQRDGAVAFGDVDTSESGPLVDASWLARDADPLSTALLQVDGDSSAYYAAHLPNAVPVDWHDELHEPVRRGPVSREHFEELMRRKGIDRDDHVVLYGTGEGTFAAHAYWIFRYYRHPRVSLLDGGLEAWARAGGRLEVAVPVVPGVGDYRSPGPDPSLRVGREELVSRYVGAPGDAVLLDCRTPQEYAGSHLHPLDLGIEHHRVGGHIPGARNLPSGRLLREDGRFRPRDELRALFAECGVTERSDVVVYCRVAERSSLLWFALHELLGHPRVRHYDGGWAEYGSLIDVPVSRDVPDGDC
jgi:thiosulfate/3-mercaptopyruvate sulfurtransferase